MLKKSKRLYLNQFILLTLALFFCSSCSKLLRLIGNDSTSQLTNLTAINATNSNFEIYKANIRRGLIRTHNFPWQIPALNQYAFTVCVNDKYNNTPLINHPFKITAVENQKATQVENQEATQGIILEKEIRSNASGCIIWYEQFHYNYFAPRSRYTEFKRRIESTTPGVVEGHISWTFFLNPFVQDRGERSKGYADSHTDRGWRPFNQSPSASYKRHNRQGSPYTVAHIRENLNSTEEETGLSLITSVNIKSSDLYNTEGIKGLGIKFYLKSNLHYSTLSTSGKKIYPLIQTGKYRLTAALVELKEVNGNNQCIYSSPKVKVKSPLKDQKLNIEFTLDWQHTLSAGPKEFYLSLEIEAIELRNQNQLEPLSYEGFLHLGNYANYRTSTEHFIAPSIIDKPCDTIYKKNQQNEFISQSDPKQKLNSEEIISVLPFQFDNIVTTDIQQRNESASIHQWNLELTLCLKLNERINNPPVNLNYYEATISTAFDQRYLERLLFKPLDEAQIIPLTQIIPLAQINPSSDVDHHLNRKNLDENGCLEFYTTLRHKFYMHDFPHLIAFKADLPYFSHHSSIMFLTLPSHKVETDEIKQVKATELPHLLGFDEKSEEETQKQMITFTADKNEIRVIDKGVKSYPIDRFLNFHIAFESTLSLEPGVRIPTSYTTDATTKDGFIEYKNLRQGIYLLRSAFINFFREPLISDSENINPLYSIAEENNHLYTSEELTYIVGQGNISQTYRFNFRDPRLNALRNHLLIQYQMVNEKKMILAFYLAKIYGLIPHNKLNNKLNLNSFPSTTFKAAHDYSKNPNDGEKKALKDVLKQSTGLCSSEKAETAEEAEEAETAFKKNQCDKRLKALESFLTEISKNSSDSNFDLLTKQHKNINSFLNDYIDCNENSPFHYTIFCKNRNSIKEALEKTLVLQKGHKYQVIDNFEKVRNILKKYLGFNESKSNSNESTLNSNDNLLELTSHIYDKDKILLLLLKIIDKSFAFLPNTSTQANNTFNHLRNVDIIINEIKKLKQYEELDYSELDYNYEKISELLYKDPGITSPVYWTPFIPSKRYGLSHVAPIYPLSELCQKDQESCEVIETITRNMEFQTKTQPEDISPESGEALESTLVNENTRSGIAQTQTQIQSQGKDYMDFLSEKGEENQTMYDTSMCYSMLSSLAFFNLKYISLHHGDETKEKDSILDKWCKEKISKSLNDFYSIYDNNNPDYAKNSNIDENTKIRMNRTKELIQSLGFKVNDSGLTDLGVTEPNDSKRFNFINDRFDLPHKDFLANLQKKSKLVEDQNAAEDQNTQTHTKPDDDTNTELDKLIIDDLKKESSYSKFKTYQNKNTLTNDDLKKSISKMIETFNPQLPNERTYDTLKLTSNNLYLPFDFSKWNVDPNLIFNFCWLWVENVTINRTLFNNHFSNDTKKEKLEKIMLDCLKSFDNLKNANNPNQETLDNIHRTKPYIVEKQKRIFEIGAVKHESGISTVLLLNSNTSVENAETIRPASTTVSTGTPFVSAELGIAKSWYLSDTDRSEERSILTVKRTILNITLKKHESCLTFFKNPHYQIWKDIHSTQDSNQDSTQSSDINYLIHLIEAMPHITMTQVPLGIKESEIINFHHMKGGGFMLCDKVSTKEEEIREHYFYIDGKLDDTTTANIAQDQNNIRNRPWSFTIRGQDTLDLFFRSIVSQSHKFRNIATQLHNLNATELPNELAKALIPLKQHYYLLSTPGVHKEWLMSNENQLVQDSSFLHRALNTLYNTFFNSSRSTPSSSQ